MSEWEAYEAVRRVVEARALSVAPGAKRRWAFPLPALQGDDEPLRLRYRFSSSILVSLPVRGLWIINPDDPEMLGDLIIVAVNEAQKKAGEAKADGIKDLTGGLDLSALGIDLSKMF